MKTLSTAFKKYGYEYELIKRNTVAAIFAQKSEDKVFAYEVIKIKIYAERKVGNSILEAGEYYPNTESWGTDGFTYSDLEKAEEKFKQFTTVGMLVAGHIPVSNDMLENIWKNPTP